MALGQTQEATTAAAAVLNAYDAVVGDGPVTDVEACVGRRRGGRRMSAKGRKAALVVDMRSNDRRVNIRPPPHRIVPSRPKAACLHSSMSRSMEQQQPSRSHLPPTVASAGKRKLYERVVVDTEEDHLRHGVRAAMAMDMDRVVQEFAALRAVRRSLPAPWQVHFAASPMLFQPVATSAPASYLCEPPTQSMS